MKAILVPYISGTGDVVNESYFGFIHKWNWGSTFGSAS